MKAYLDSSELVHRAEAILNGHPWTVPLDTVAHLVTSQVSAVELSRVLFRSQDPARVRTLVASTLTTVDAVATSPAVLALAASLPVRHLKSLDAIHVASALITRCDVVLTRDRQMARACTELGLSVT